MATEIVFGGGASIVVAADVEQVKGDIERHGMGRPLLQYTLDARHKGEIVDVLVNWGQIAYVRKPEPAASRAAHGF